MRTILSVGVKPETYKHYKEVLKPQGYTWNTIINKGMNAIAEETNGHNTTAIIDKLQKVITKQGMENEILRNKFKMQELKDKLTNQEISPEEYEQFKQMYEEKIKSIDTKIQEAEE
jgi:SMC interacting uncharacterized protein involved in chromosome segregation